jgi:hypothetical protein
MASALVIPVLGEFTAFFLFNSAIPGLLRDRKSGVLSTDPLPFPIAMVCNLLWVLYACLIQDPWVLLGNMMGISATTFNTLTVLKLSKDENALRPLELIAGVGIVFVSVMISLTMTPMFISDFGVRRSILGNVCIAIFCIMCGSPTLAALKALKTGDASSISLPLALAQLANGLLWGVYGLAQQDIVLSGPNLLGALLALINVVAKLRSFCSFTASAVQPKSAVKEVETPEVGEKSVMSV